MFVRVWPTEKLIYLPFETDHFKSLQHVSATNYSAASLSSTITTPMNKSGAMAYSSSIAGGSSTKSSPKSLAGAGYIILNGIRVMNVIALLAVITASIVMLVKTTIDSKFFFFDAVSHVMTAVTGMFLCTSEVSLFRGYFERNWPLLSPSHGFVTLAIAMIVLGVDMLGNLNKPATSQKALGLPFWRIVIGSGIIIFVMGFANFVANYVFRDRKQGITARQVRAHGAVAVHKTPRVSGTGSPTAPALATSMLSSNPFTPTKPANPFRSPTTTSRDDNDRRNSLLPSYQTAASMNSPPREPVSPTSRYSRATACTKKKVFSFMGGRNRTSVGPVLPVNVYDTTSASHGGDDSSSRPMEISSPMAINPQFAHLVSRPDSALHPSRNNEGQAYRWRS